MKTHIRVEKALNCFSRKGRLNLLAVKKHITHFLDAGEFTCVSGDTLGRQRCRNYEKFVCKSIFVAHYNSQPFKNRGDC